jgi:Uma2 family endonuclease
MGLMDEPLVLQRHRLDVERYHRMGEAGVIAPDARVELIEGEVIDMAPIGSRHWAMVNRLDLLLKEAVRRAAIVSVQAGIGLDDWNEPEPDIAIVRARPDFYAGSLPSPADVLLLVEVADATLRYDREIKQPLYARHGIAELWIVDLQNGLLHRCRRPQDGRYLEEATDAAPGVVPVGTLPGATVDLAGLFG